MSVGNGVFVGGATVGVSVGVSVGNAVFVGGSTVGVSVGGGGVLVGSSTVAVSVGVLVESPWADALLAVVAVRTTVANTVRKATAFRSLHL